MCTSEICTAEERIRFEKSVSGRFFFVRVDLLTVLRVMVFLSTSFLSLK